MGNVWIVFTRTVVWTRIPKSVEMKSQAVLLLVMLFLVAVLFGSVLYHLILRPVTGVLGYEEIDQSFRYLLIRVWSVLLLPLPLIFVVPPY